MTTHSGSRLLRVGVRRWPGQVTDTGRAMTRTPYGGDPGSGPVPRAAAWPPHVARPVHRTPSHAADLRERAGRWRGGEASRGRKTRGRGRFPALRTPAIQPTARAVWVLDLPRSG
ncbi:hypothetical protein GCM10009680_35490 [Streptomyces yatensis]|uniref:Uncharacterized protein n=1 Tax=Streptomyces yatensis TaxID=155177 RepID=A0ABN2HSH2_9ACTN